MTRVCRHGSFASLTDHEAHIHASPWQTASTIPSLDRGHVHIWLANVPELAPRASYFDELIDAGERARLDAFRLSADQLRHLVTRGVLRSLASHYLAAPATALRFAQGPFGKPALHDDPELTFNVSHSGDIVLLAFAREGDIGVDVERWNARLGDPDRRRLAESVFSITERAAIRALSSPAERERAFYTLWSRKEAYLKGTGAGISGGLSHVDLSIDGSARVIDDRQDANAVERWTLRDLDVGAGYSAAVALTPPRQEVVLFTPSLHLFDDL